MNKRITSIVLSLVMLFTMLATAVPVFAATPVALKVTADTTSAHPGDTINYKVFVGAVTNMGGLEFRLNIPSGLTIVDDSISIPTGLETTIDSDGAIVVPKSGNGYKWSYSAQMTGYTGSSDLVILNFACTVDDGASGDKIVTINVDTFFDNDPPYPELDYTVTPATVNVTAAPVAVTGVTIDETLSVNIGQTKTPSYTVAPAEATNKTVSFTSNNPAVATVNATTGAVTGVSKGTAVITVKTADGNFTDTCTVTVSCAHSYTAETKKAEALKTAGNCRDKAVYYYSCSVCGNVEHNDAHTFLGDKNASVHVGGTSTVNASAPDHKNQVDGYTGDTKCLGCGEITATGTTIPAGAHTPSSTWNNDGTYHWKECTTMGCGVVIDGSKAAHSSTGTNVATCQHKAVCDVCHVEYGALAAHNPASGWTSDASGHWHACQTAGCTEKCDFATHTPDHTGHATEEYAIKCTECGYVIEAQLGHTHVFNKEVATDAYKASDATCTAKATYYKSCACGEKGTATFEYGELADHNWTPATCTAPKTCSVCHATEGDPLGHTEGTEWKSDKDNHWHTCTVAGCGVVIDSSKAAHTPDRASATETDAVKCSVCGYVITPALGHTHAVDTTKYESDETNHWNTCSGCSEKQNVSAHEFEWKIDKDATATEKGSKHEECKVCGYKKVAVEIPATGTPTDPTPENPNSPQTGDNSMIGLWIALLFVSGAGVAGTTLYSRKRKSVK